MVGDPLCLVVVVCPWAETEEGVARNQLETCIGAYSAQTLLCWDHAHGFDADRVV